jgi:YHS domain-containing protein
MTDIGETQVLPPGSSSMTAPSTHLLEPRVDPWTATRFAEREGRRYVFCSQICLERFQANEADRKSAVNAHRNCGVGGQIGQR